MNERWCLVTATSPDEPKLEEDPSLYEDNELTAVGKVCARCGHVIQSWQETRRRADGQWMHEVCPL